MAGLWGKEGRTGLGLLWLSFFFVLVVSLCYGSQLDQQTRWRVVKKKKNQTRWRWVLAVRMHVLACYLLINLACIHLSPCIGWVNYASFLASD
jgi:hypothetical protein